jgi:hypothetical protein
VYLVYCSAPDKIIVVFPVTSNESNADLFLSYVPLKVNINISYKLSAFLKNVNISMSTRVLVEVEEGDRGLPRIEVTNYPNIKILERPK